MASCSLISLKKLLAENLERKIKVAPMLTIIPKPMLPPDLYERGEEEEMMI